MADDLRFKQHWEDKAKYTNEREVVFGKVLGQAWSRDRDREAFMKLATCLDMERESAVLDIGCGLLARAEVQYSLQGLRIVGVDISPTAVNHAQAHVKKEGVPGKTDFVVADAEALPFRSDNFNVVLCIGAICHLPSKDSLVKALSEMKRVTKMHGKIFIPWWINFYSISGLERKMMAKLFDILRIPRAQYLTFHGVKDVCTIINNSGLTINKMCYGSLLQMPWILFPSPTKIRNLFARVIELLNDHHRKNSSLSRLSYSFEVTCQKTGEFRYQKGTPQTREYGEFF